MKMEIWLLQKENAKSPVTKLKQKKSKMKNGNLFYTEWKQDVVFEMKYEITFSIIKT